jgi:hypothetical protein
MEHHIGSGRRSAHLTSAREEEHEASLHAGARRARWVVRARLAEHPAYLPLARGRHGERMLSGDTELVIDGFTRTACVFATIAFQLAQPRPVRVAHVIHSPAHVIAAARRRIPVLLTVREPRGAVLSCMVREPFVSAHAALIAYCRFHERLAPWRASVVVGEFERVTTDLGAVTAELNARFGTDFAPFEASEENVARVFALIEERARRPAWDRWIGHFMCGRASLAELEQARGERRASGAADRFEERAARPSAHKEARKAALEAAYDDPSLAALRARAEAARAAFVGHRDDAAAAGPA